MRGFRTFLLQGNLIVIAVGLVVALAFSTLIDTFCTSIITPLVNAAEGSGNAGKGLGFTVNHQFVHVGALVSGIVYFIIFLSVVYFVLVVPYRRYMATKGTTVFGAPAATKTCPHCLQGDVPAAATKCWHCTADLTAPAA